MASDDDDIPLSSLFTRAPTKSSTDPSLAGSRRPREHSPTDEESAESPRPPPASGRKRARSHYVLDNLGGDDAVAENQDEYDLGSSASEESGDASSDSQRDVSRSKPPPSESPSGSDGGFNYLAFDAARDRDLDKQRRSAGLGIAAALGVDASSRALDLPTAVDAYLRFLAAALLLPDGGESVVRGLPASPDALLWDAARSRVERDLLQRRDGFASSRAWQPAVRVAVDLLPSFADSFSGDVAGDVVAGEDCAVCGRSGHPAICTVRLSGPLCDAAGMMAPPREAAAGWWTDQVPLGDHALYAAHFAAGRQCRQRLECYSALQHFKVRLLATLSAWLRRRLWDDAHSVALHSADGESSSSPDEGTAPAPERVRAYDASLYRVLTVHLRESREAGLRRSKAARVFALAAPRREFLKRRLADIETLSDMSDSESEVSETSTSDGDASNSASAPKEARASPPPPPEAASPRERDRDGFSPEPAASSSALGTVELDAGPAKRWHSRKTGVSKAFVALAAQAASVAAGALPPPGPAEGAPPRVSAHPSPAAQSARGAVVVVSSDDDAERPRIDDDEDDDIPLERLLAAARRLPGSSEARAAGPPVAAQAASDASPASLKPRPAAAPASAVTGKGVASPAVAPHKRGQHRDARRHHAHADHWKWAGQRPPPSALPVAPNWRRVVLPLFETSKWAAFARAQADALAALLAYSASLYAIGESSAARRAEAKELPAGEAFLESPPGLSRGSAGLLLTQQRWEALLAAEAARSSSAADEGGTSAEEEGSGDHSGSSSHGSSERRKVRARRHGGSAGRRRRPEASSEEEEEEEEGGSESAPSEGSSSPQRQVPAKCLRPSPLRGGTARGAAAAREGRRRGSGERSASPASPPRASRQRQRPEASRGGLRRGAGRRGSSPRSPPSSSASDEEEDAGEEEGGEGDGDETTESSAADSEARRPAAPPPRRPARAGSSAAAASGRGGGGGGGRSVPGAATAEASPAPAGIGSLLSLRGGLRPVQK